MKPVTQPRRDLEIVKTALLAEGLRIAEGLSELLLEMSGGQLSVHEYPTTGGLTLVLDEGVHVNAPFDEWYCAQATTELLQEDGHLVLRDRDRTIAVRSVLPLPGFLGALDSEGAPVEDVAMSHADRVRLSPIVGCAYNCGFCDLGDRAYERRSAARLIRALRVAEADEALPVRHVLISGGSPRSAHYDEFIEICEQVIRSTPLPVGVMMSPMVGRLDVIDRLVDSGVESFAINIELYSTDASRSALKGKFLTARRYLEATLLRAVDRLGSGGRVRSLIIPGLEGPEETLAGVEYLAALGCDPVLSPFRPAQGTALVGLRPPSAATLLDVLDESRSIVSRHGVALGPACGPCQHNTLSFPWDLRASSAVNGSSARARL